MQILWVALCFALIYSMERIFFAFWNWRYYKNQNWPDILYAFYKGFHYDLSATSTLLLFILPIFAIYSWIIYSEKKDAVKKYMAIFLGVLIFASQFPFMILSCIDNELVFITGQRFTWGAMYNFKEVPGKTDSFASYYYPLIVACIFFGILMILSIYVNFRKAKIQKIWIHFAGACAGLVLFMFCGLQFYNLDFAQANTSQKPILYNLTLNTTYNFLHSIEENEKELERLKFHKSYQRTDLSGDVKTASHLEGHRLQRPQNVVVFILESFNSDYKEYTPFLNELSQKGIAFHQNYANGRRSIEGVTSILAGIPGYLSTPFLLTEYFKVPFDGIGHWLQKKNYDTSFFHGAHNSTMHFNELTAKLGIQHYYGLNEYPHPEHHDGAWGIPDHIYMNYMAHQLSEKKPPFFATLFTLSSHHPFKVPPEFKSKFKKGPLDILESIQYTDESIRLFFEEAKKQSWYKDTLFVFIADHTYKPIAPLSQNLISTYQVPLIFYHPSFQWPNSINTQKLTNQIDVLPSILDFLGIPSSSPRLCLGKSVFSPDDGMVINYLDRKDLMLTPKYRATQFLFGDFQLYEPGDDWLQKPIHDEALTEAAMLRLSLHRKYFKDFFEDYKHQGLCPEF